MVWVDYKSSYGYGRKSCIVRSAKSKTDNYFILWLPYSFQVTDKSLRSENRVCYDKFTVFVRLPASTRAVSWFYPSPTSTMVELIPQNPPIRTTRTCSAKRTINNEKTAMSYIVSLSLRSSSLPYRINTSHSLPHLSSAPFSQVSQHKQHPLPHTAPEISRKMCQYSDTSYACGHHESRSWTYCTSTLLNGESCPNGVEGGQC